MTDPERTIEILNELLRAEAASLLPRLSESTPFISWADADEMALVRRLVDEEQEHQAALGACILSGGGTPAPVLADITSGDVHYLALNTLLPRILADKERLVRVYQVAVARLAPGDASGRLAARILDAHRRQLAELQRFGQLV